MKKIRLLFLVLVVFTIIFTLSANPLFADSKTQVTEFVGRFYHYFLDREADAAGLDSYVKKLLARKITGAVVVSDFVLSPEYTAKKTSNEDFVASLFRACFNREPDSQGFSSWVDILDKGYSRQYVMAGFVNSDEFKKLCSSYGIKSGSLDPGAAPQIIASHIPIALLHGIEHEPVGRYEISAGALDMMCSTLKSMGYETITLTDLYNHYTKGTKLPAKPVILTSDDGYQDLYTVALPILKKYNYKMTVFLITSYIGDNEQTRRLNDFDAGTKNIAQRPMLIWPEIKQMSRYGIEFQSHTWSHGIISNVSLETAKFELAQSKSDIEVKLGKSVIFVAWPHGQTSSEVISLLPQVGYAGALLANGGVQSLSSINFYSLKRVSIVAEIAPQAYGEVLQLQ